MTQPIMVVHSVVAPRLLILDQPQALAAEGMIRMGYPEIPLRIRRMGCI